MRDALAKWGAHPAVAGEPIGHLYCGGSYGDELADWEIVADQHQCDKLNEHHGSLGKEAKLPIYTTQQPTQAQAGAGPLTMCRGFARAIEAEVRKDDEALIRQMLEALDSCDPGLYMGTNGSDTPYYDARKVGAAIANARARLAPPPPTA